MAPPPTADDRAGAREVEALLLLEEERLVP
jgi:hypothetical protein